jgi:hypothetical protein
MLKHNPRYFAHNSQTVPAATQAGLDESQNVEKPKSVEQLPVRRAVRIRTAAPRSQNVEKPKSVEQLPGSFNVEKPRSVEQLPVRRAARTRTAALRSQNVEKPKSVEQLPGSFNVEKPRSVVQLRVRRAAQTAAPRTQHRRKLGEPDVTTRGQKRRFPRENERIALRVNQENPVSPQFIFGNNSRTREKAEKNGKISRPRETDATRK